MGALTLKSFTFELRGWEIEKFESLDPTDSFGSNTRVYVNKDQIILIEPEYNNNNFNTWITDKGRQFFDGMLNSWKNKHNKQHWVDVIKTLSQAIYVLNHCNRQYYSKNFFTIVFENISLEVLNILVLLSQNYPFIKLRRAENFSINNDLESNFQLNIASNKIKLNNSTMCILIANNPRYEGYYLNLNLKQRYLKGNFNCFNIGSIIDLTFPVEFLGSNIKILKNISEGNNLFCRDLKKAKNPLIVYNSELFKRSDSKNLLKMLKLVNSVNYSNKNWNNLNTLSTSLCENGIQLTSKFPILNSIDFNNSFNLYFINISENNNKTFNKITELNLLTYSLNKINKSNSLFLDQNYKFNSNLEFFKKNNLNMYKHIPTNIFYENEETFINTEGYIKRTTKLISKENKSNWQIIRKFLKHFKNNLNFLNDKNNELIYFNSKKLFNFKNYTNFNYYAIQSLTNLNFYLTINTKPITFHQNFFNFKTAPKKLQNTKIKYWLDDFFIGGKDEYSQNSFILTNCSKVLRSESTNFF
jgi:NADH dehydrogenase/NADH:ubiquinone oxidoreductase subunit G